MDSNIEVTSGIKQEIINVISTTKKKKRIRFDDLKDIEVFASKEVIMQFPLIVNKFRKEIGLEYNEFLFLANLNSGKFTKEQTKLVSQYNALILEHEQQLFLNEHQNIDIDIIKEITEYKQNILDKLAKLPEKLFSLISSSEELYDELIKILILATDDIEKETFENSDIRVLIELGLQIFFTPESQLTKALFFNRYLTLMWEFIQSLDFIKSVKKLILREKTNE